ncbi:hypothetical protein [Tardiphaga robiniae]|uniref:Uncharacterized protein n=1 Tax=Tardiphaga robiniae TaxID=943830 RepID=A0A7G6U1S6_9BRAD|nr:hypothetical protein [Tardiphaga robiniae]QND72958.1 hypothetical protein HB776_18435 [Tardiphaga robiniae]
MTLGELLQARGFDPAGVMAIRNTLHSEDVSNDFRDLTDVISANALPMYDRMQDGPRIAHQTAVLSFAATDGGQARLTSLRTFLLRKPGSVPSDIVYDYDAAHLLHSFIARATTPCFYDAIDREELNDLFGRLVVQWPEPLSDNILAANDDALTVVVA